MADDYIRFQAGWAPVDKGVPPLELYIYLVNSIR
jgi:hypothetical protein